MNHRLPEKEKVNHPEHYNQGKFECIDVIKDLGKEMNGFEGFCIGNAIKYLWRYNCKDNPIEDLKKAIWYIQRVIDSRNK